MLSGVSMILKKSQLCCLSGNALKFIAAVAMVCDHAGLLLFPRADWMRIVGRLSFPIFAFMISEGAKHTKNRSRYLFTLASFATVIQLGYFFYSQSLEMSVMITFAISVCLIYLLDLVKTLLFSETAPIHQRVLSVLGLFLSIIFVRVLCAELDVDYGFWGCMLPVFASLPVTPRKDPHVFFSFTDRIPVRLATMTVGLLFLSVALGDPQIWSLLSLPILLLYSGERGTLRTKYFFYVFYPLHLILLEGINMLIDAIR